MRISEFLENLTGEYPICEYAFGEISLIEFSDKVFTICETDCKRYGHSWACPPNAGMIAENIARIQNYDHFFLFSSVWEVEDAWDTEKCLSVKREHEEMSRNIRERMLETYHLPKESLEEEPAPDLYMLSTGCTLCEQCACPSEACRYPADRLMSMESHGILIVKLVEECGLTSGYDGNTVVYFTMILYPDRYDMT